MDRRNFLNAAVGAGVSAGHLWPAPALSQPARSRVLRFIPQSDLANFDPVVTSAYVVRNAAMLVWDTLYGLDASLMPRRQMIESEEVSEDGLSWTFRLREGQRFHDGEPVRARDAVASIARWSARDPLGQMIKAVEDELAPLDDLTFRWRLRKPFRKMLLALGKVTPPCCFVMPERIARTDPSRPIGEYVGSGPARFVRREWVPGASAVFERFAGYSPSPTPSSWTAGAKTLAFDRIEWQVIPDAATAAVALQSGEADWWERPLPDLIPKLRKDARLSVVDADPFGQVGLLNMNHLHPPFSDVRARRAILMALSQEEYMSALGAESGDWRPMPGYFAPGPGGAALGSGGILTGTRDLDAARALIRASGYAGEPVVCLAAQDIASHKVYGDLTADLLERLGMKVDLIATDWGTVVARRSQKAPPGKGGWNLYVSSIFGVDTLDPVQRWIHAAGDIPNNGWAKSDEVESLIAAWFDTTSPDQEQAILGRINQAALDYVVYAPLGIYLLKYCTRKDLLGVTSGPMPFFWGVSRRS